MEIESTTSGRVEGGLPSVGKGVNIPSVGKGVNIPSWEDDGCGPGFDPGDDCEPSAGTLTVMLTLTSVPGATSTVEVEKSPAASGGGGVVGT